MKAYFIEQNIKFSTLPSTLRSDIPEPNPLGNEVLIDVYAAGLNFFDILQVEGRYQHKPPFPYVPGAEFSGIISSESPIPKGCPFVPGRTRVFGAGQGAYGEKIKVDWRNLIEVPEGMDLEEAAGIYVTYPTSYAALVLRAELKKGETLLVHAGAGGVGISACQIGKALGATVIATASTSAKLEICKKYGGVDHVVNYSQEGWQKTILELTGGKGADVIYDPVGLITPSLKCIAFGGRALVVGFAGGNIEKIPMNLVLLKNISLVGIHWGAYSVNEPGTIPQVWSAILQLIREGRLRAVLFDKVYDGLESVYEGLKDLNDRKTWGKAVVRIKKQTKGKDRRESKL